MKKEKEKKNTLNIFSWIHPSSGPANFTDSEWGMIEVTYSESSLLVTVCLEASQSDPFSPWNLHKRANIWR